MQQTLGRTLLIANPVSRSGMGKAGATAIERRLRELPEQVPTFDVYLTTGPGDAVHIAANAQGYDTVLVLGGDGVIHEAANGLMQIPKASRPTLGPIPLGSGNDYARTLHITRNKPEKALEELLDGRKIAADLGLVNGVYFVQTLSFGLDAAIALDTMNHRSTGRGAHLFADSGFKIFSSAKQGYAFKAEIDGVPAAGNEAVFAVQVGPTYGGGFRVCPKAVVDDGKLDVCYSKTLPAVPVTLGIFCLARFGLHTHSKHLFFAQPKHITIDFESAPPCQVDGERLEGTHFDISICPGALEVLIP
ncbi:diacylglycerol kinase family protein [Olsenella sp. YH-ols2221]|uniref:diacylglycerol/lipid kinase family protein n=1 Tax=Olsenella kribbiana TaxID=3115221 RepID=UPI002A85085E|nr:diacylglycerol kinase family lipid kinase [Atopobiaceae bacterium]